MENTKGFAHLVPLLIVAVLLTGVAIYIYSSTGNQEQPDSVDMVANIDIQNEEEEKEVDSSPANTSEENMSPTETGFKNMGYATSGPRSMVYSGTVKLSGTYHRVGVEEGKNSHGGEIFSFSVNEADLHKLPSPPAYSDRPHPTGFWFSNRAEADAMLNISTSLVNTCSVTGEAVILVDGYNLFLADFFGGDTSKLAYVYSSTSPRCVN